MDDKIFVLFGLSQALLGLFSFTYHMCPNRVTLPFDTMFMTVIATLFICKMHRLNNGNLVNFPQWIR